MQKIKDRQELIENTGAYAPFLIFPEGTTSNGTCLLKFRKGAFYSEKKVQPIYMKFNYNTISPAYDILDFLPLAILNLCLCCFTCVLTILPDFEPNEYLFETHKDKGKERWEIYAWAIREIIQKNG